MDPAAAAEIAMDGVARLGKAATHILMDEHLEQSAAANHVTEAILDESLSKKYAPLPAGEEALTPTISTMTKVKVRDACVHMCSKAAVCWLYTMHGSRLVRTRRRGNNTCYPSPTPSSSSHVPPHCTDFEERIERHHPARVL
jgi:hypothetical protein